VADPAINGDGTAAFDRRAAQAPGRRRRVLGCLALGLALLIVSPFAIIFGFVVADKVVFELTGDCVPAPMTSDACRGSYSFDVWNRTKETIDVVAIRAGGPEISVLRRVAPGTFGPSDSFEVAGGKCEPKLHVIARTASGRVVAERTGICRREDWEITEP
jgi:hypothetical protein